MASKMSMLRGRDDTLDTRECYKRANYTNNHYDSDSDYDDEEDFYDNYEPYEEEFDYDNEYQPFDPEKEEEEYRSSITKERIAKIKPKPYIWMNSPTKSVEKSPAKSPSWWDKNKIIDENTRMVNGVLNYAALLPPPTKKEEVKIVEKPKAKKTKKPKNPKPAQEQPKQEKLKPTPVQQPTENKPTRFCLSVIKKSKCFHGKLCRFAHDYSELKECNFGEKCKKISVVKTNPDGTLELNNKNEVVCNFKHAKESKASYLKRVPQQHTSPKNKK